MKRTNFKCILVLLLGVAAAQGQTSWSATGSGCELQVSTLQDGGLQVGFILLRCDPKLSEVRLIDTARVLGKANPYAAFSLREVLNETHASIVANAGSTTSLSVPSPAGLLEIGGTIVSKAKLNVKNTGILCIKHDSVDIAEFTSNVPEGCLDAVQRGPFLSHDLIAANDGSGRFQRTVVAVDNRGRLLILVTKDGAHLSAIAAFLYGSRFSLGTRAALNLDGGTSSGLIFAKDQGVKDTVTGNVDGLVASAIAIRKRH